MANEIPTIEPETSVQPGFELPAVDAWLDVDQGILDALPVGFFCCDASGHLVRANRRAAELWGLPKGSLAPLGDVSGAFRLETLAGNLIVADDSFMGRALRQGETFEGAEIALQNPDGRRWVARVNVAPLRDKAGRIVGAVNCFQDVTQEHEMREALDRQQRTFDLAMIAADMGTWRYTLADHVCLYDENAQRLYGLAEARFLHDEAGVASKFHPDDLELMWTRVAEAIDPEGDGRYAVEYRVKQPDGAWRWLSAWGLTEFEGAGEARKPVAIAGASRDLSEQKRTEQLRRLLVNELNHRVKNTLAMVQSIATFTLRDASDLRSAQDALNERIISLGRVHDLLTARSWSGADLRDVVTRAMQPFDAAQIDVDGPSLEVSPRLALALSLALHELATNAVKYGALSDSRGRVEVRWTCDAERLTLTWRERGGPPVQPPTRRGFGSRLLEDGLARDLGGRSKLDYAPEGLTCALTAILSQTTDDHPAWAASAGPAPTPPAKAGV